MAMLVLNLLVGKQYRFQQHLSCIKQVDCNQCGTRYYYQMGRTGTGLGFSWFSLFDERALHLAQQRATQVATKLIESETEFVPCPKCLGLNRELVKGYAKRYQVTGLGILISLIIGMPLCTHLSLLTYNHLLPQSPALKQSVISLGMAMGVLAPLWLWLWTRLRRWTLNPQAHRARRAEDAPLPMLEVVDEQGRRWLETAINQNDLAHPNRSGVSLTFYPGMPLPGVCCACMTPTSNRYIQNLFFQKFHVPVCVDCIRQYHLKYWRYMLLVGLVPLSIAIVAGLWFYWNGTLTHKHVTGMAAGVVMLTYGVGLFWIDEWCVPCICKEIDARSNLFEFKARHPDFNQMLLQLKPEIEPQRLPFDPDEEMLT